MTGKIPPPDFVADVALAMEVAELEQIAEASAEIMARTSATVAAMSAEGKTDDEIIAAVAAQIGASPDYLRERCERIADLMFG